MTDDFISSFIDEARELLSQLERDLLLLEKMPGDRELTDSIFRVMHNLKGAASMYGFEEMQDLAHEFENIFELIRSEKLRVSQSLIDDTLKGRDTLLAIMDRNVSAHEVRNRIVHLKTVYGSVGAGEDSANTPQKRKVMPEDQIFWIALSPDKAVFERGLNPDKVVEEIKTLGKTHTILHEGKMKWEKQKEKKICQSSWEIYLYAPVTLDKIEEVFLFYDQDEYRIFPVNETHPESESFIIDYLQRYVKKGITTGQHFRQCMEAVKPERQVDAGTELQKEDPDGKPCQPAADMQKMSKEATISVSSHKLDELMNLVSELVISSASLEVYADELKDPRLKNIIENVEKLTKKFRSNALNLRLIPIGNLLGKFNRQVRDLATTLGKEVTLILDGHETEIDKTILRSIESPLMHLVRNSLDHGIESPEERIAKGKTAQGMLKIAAFYSGASVVVQIHDDGRGINLERIKELAISKGYISPEQRVSDHELLNLIMEPGFTTTDNVSLVSGRGVGMDVVKKELMAIGGSLEVETEKDLGTSITMKLPTTLSIIDTLELDVNGKQYLVPLLEVEYCYKESRKNLYGRNDPYLPYKNDMVPFLSLRSKFRYPDTDSQHVMVVILSKYEKRVALVVDDVVGEQQTVIKPLGKLFINQPYFSGGSIMASGNLALVLDTNYLFNQSGLK